METRPGARTLYVSGQVGQTPEGHLPSDFRGQYRQALLNVSAVLAAVSITFVDIVKRSFFLDGVRPAITTVFVAGLVSPDWLVEVEVVACAE